MSTSANLRGWGPGWPADRSAEMKRVTAAQSGAHWDVHREIAPILNFVVNEVEHRGYLFDHGSDDVDDDWGYANRPIGGTRKPSNHSWGLAIDFDAQEYPQHSSRRAPQWIYDLFYAYGFEIGADWGRASVDPMHVEFRGSITEARHMVAMLAASYVAGAAPEIPGSTPPPTPAQSEEDDTMDLLVKIDDGRKLPAGQSGNGIWWRANHGTYFIDGELYTSVDGQYRVGGVPVIRLANPPESQMGQLRLR